MERNGSVLIQAIPGLPEIHPGDDLGALLVKAIREDGWTLQATDILVVAHKIVSKAEGKVVDLSAVEPGEEAIRLAAKLGKDPRKVEVVLSESTSVLRERILEGREEGLMICEHRLGFICANAGVDSSNVPGAERVVLLPEDPDQSARGLRDAIEKETGIRIGVIVSDTFGRPWRKGLVNVSIGQAGPPAIVDWSGKEDGQGDLLRVTAPAFADEVATAAGLMMDKAKPLPAVLVRGLRWSVSPDSAKEMLRSKDEDLFR